MAGDFETFVAAESSRLLRLGWLLTGDWATAQDLVQTALVEAWRHWDGIARKDEPQLYVRKIMIRTQWRWRRRRAAREILTPEVDAASSAAPVGDTDLRAALVTALRSLPPRQRAVIALATSKTSRRRPSRSCSAARSER